MITQRRIFEILEMFEIFEIFERYFKDQEIKMASQKMPLRAPGAEMGRIVPFWKAETLRNSVSKEVAP